MSIETLKNRERGSVPGENLHAFHQRRQFLKKLHYYRRHLRYLRRGYVPDFTRSFPGDVNRANALKADHYQLSRVIVPEPQ